MLGVVGWKVWLVSNFAQQHARTSNNMQQGVQTNATCNIQGNVGSCWPTMLRPFARGLTRTANSQTNLCNVTMYYRSFCCLEVIKGCKPAKALSLSLITKTLSVKIQSSISGVVIHKNLTWNEHIEWLIAKVNQRIGFLDRITHLLPLDARVALYNVLIRPLFDFADTIRADRDNITLMHDLQVLQNQRLPKLSLICPTMLHLPTLSKHSDGLPYFKSALYIDTLPLLSTSTDL